MTAIARIINAHCTHPKKREDFDNSVLEAYDQLLLLRNQTDDAL